MPIDFVGQKFDNMLIIKIELLNKLNNCPFFLLGKSLTY